LVIIPVKRKSRMTNENLGAGCRTQVNYWSIGVLEYWENISPIPHYPTKIKCITKELKADR
jgi:hypothetical protein